MRRQFNLVLILAVFLSACNLPPAPTNSTMKTAAAATQAIETATAPKPTQTPQFFETQAPIPYMVDKNTSTPTSAVPQAKRNAEATIASFETQTPVSVEQYQQGEDDLKATLTAFGIDCAKPEQGPFWSPNGLWIAEKCQGKDRFSGSYLRVASVQGDKIWTVYYDNYANGFDAPFYPLRVFHWSKNGKYVYLSATTRASGCCEIGGTLLFVRLNLENGQQTVIFNYASNGSGSVGVDVSISSSESYVLYFSGKTNGLLYILDLLTWEQRTIDLKYPLAGAGYTLMSNDDSKVILIIRAYPEVYQGDFTYGSLVLLDLKNETQKKFLPGYEFEFTPMPYRWEDAEHVLLCPQLQCDGKNFLLMDINTGELKSVTNP